MNHDNYILIADSHLRQGEEGPFFEMLDRIRQYHPAGVLFLGDIFELWIALDGYESDIHFRFLQWCREAKKQFEVGFIVGNHEFYIIRRYADAFTWITEQQHILEKPSVLLLHGDLLNLADKGYFVLRRFLRHPVTRFLLKITGYSIGPKVANYVLMSLKPKNLQFKRSLPMPYLEQFSKQSAGGKFKKIFAGHFHHHHDLDFSGGVPCEILPAWGTAGEIVLLQPDLKSECGPWQELLK